MAYTKNVWADRDVQYPNRYTLTNVSGTTYDVARAEGTVNEAGTLFNADKMNNIENGVEVNDLNITKLDNVTKYLVATAATNGDYKVNITNTLATNMIVYIYFPAAATNTQNARLSIDNGSNYKNIIDIHGSQILSSDIENSKKTLLYNGTSFEAIDFKNCITAFLNTSSSSTVAQYASKQAVLNTEFSKYGKSLSMSNGFIKNIGTTPIKIAISGVMNLNLPVTKNATIGVALYSTDNSANYVKTLANVYSAVPALPTAYSFSAFNYILSPGYALSLEVQNQSASGTFVIYGRTTELATYLSVHEL